jgi:hypothetical protein
MRITQQQVAQKLIDYLNHEITLSELVDWAELAMMEAEFENQNFEILRDIISRLGLADVRAFGVTFEDFEGFLSRLGYNVKVKVTKKQATA